jgi:hypothetical protein
LPTEGLPTPQTMAESVHNLGYISCMLTVISTLLVGRKLWQGWIIAGANSALICLIGIRTAQFGFVPANLFCIALYSYNVRSWKKGRLNKHTTLAAPVSDEVLSAIA